METLVGIYNVDHLEQIILGKSYKHAAEYDVTGHCLFSLPGPLAYIDFYIPIFTTPYSEDQPNYSIGGAYGIMGKY